MFIATTIGLPAARAWLIDSIVCGCTPSAADTTSTTTSVMSAPRARMDVKAWWPGVSIKVTRLAVLTFAKLHHPRGGMLRDAAGFAGRDVGLADAVEQAGFAVIDVAENGDHRRAGDHVLGDAARSWRTRRPDLLPASIRTAI